MPDEPEDNGGLTRRLLVWAAVTITVAFIGAGAVVFAAVLTSDGDAPTTAPASTSVESPTEQPSSPVAFPPNFEDNFNDNDIDLVKWQPQDNDGRIQEKGRRLHLGVEGQVYDEFLWEALDARTGTDTIQEANFVLTLGSAIGGDSGGGGIDLFLENGRVFYLDVGNELGAGEELGLAEILYCPLGRSCSEDADDDYELSNRGSFPIGEPTPIRVVWTGTDIEFYVGGTLRASEDASESPLTRVRFFTYVDEGSSYHATVDDFRIQFRVDE